MKIFFLLSVLVLVGCNGCQRQKATEQPMSEKELMEKLVAHNKAAHEAEIEAIDDFIKVKGWPVVTTGTGLRYWIYESGTGENAKLDDFASISYEVYDLEGQLIYEAKKEDPGVFKIGQDNVESGLHEMVLLMKVGDKAKVVLPSYLAFGLTGDSKKIAQNMPLYYNLELVALN